jgi:hypothetical protein
VKVARTCGQKAKLCDTSRVGGCECGCVVEGNKDVLVKPSDSKFLSVLVGDVGRER